ETVEVLQRVELRLVGEADAGAALEAEDAGVGHPVCLGVGGARRFELFLELFDLPVPAEEEETVEPLEATVDVLLVADRLDAIDRARVAVAREPRAVGAVQPQHLLECVVDDVRQVRGRYRRLPVADVPCVDHDDRPSLPREQVRGGQAGDAGADDAHISGGIALERFGGHRVGSVQPERCTFRHRSCEVAKKTPYMAGQGGPKTLPAAFVAGSWWRGGCPG